MVELSIQLKELMSQLGGTVISTPAEGQNLYQVSFAPATKNQKAENEDSDLVKKAREAGDYLQKVLHPKSAEDSQKL